MYIKLYIILGIISFIPNILINSYADKKIEKGDITKEKAEDLVVESMENNMPDFMVKTTKSAVEDDRKGISSPTPLAITIGKVISILFFWLIWPIASAIQIRYFIKLLKHK